MKKIKTALIDYYSNMWFYNITFINVSELIQSFL